MTPPACSCSSRGPLATSRMRLPRPDDPCCSSRAQATPGVAASPTRFPSAQGRSGGPGDYLMRIMVHAALMHHSESLRNPCTPPEAGIGVGGISSRHKNYIFYKALIMLAAHGTRRSGEHAVTAAPSRTTVAAGRPLARWLSSTVVEQDRG